MSLHPPNQQRTRRTCTVPGCDRRYEARGYCTLHYERWRRSNEAQGGTPPLARQPQGRQRIYQGCSIPGCDEKHAARGFCSRHYYQQRAQQGSNWANHTPRVTQPWTPERLALLDQMLEEARPRHEMAVALNCTVKAVASAIDQHDIRSERERHLTMPGVAALLGVLPWVVRQWVADGYLRTVGTTPNIFVRRADLVAFLSMPAHWHRWDPDSITDSALKRGAIKVRGSRHNGDGGAS